MIGEIATAAKVAERITVETVKEAGKEVVTKSVDISKRIDVTKQAAEIGPKKVDIGKRINPLSEMRTKDVAETLKDYLSDLKSKSEFPDTIKSFEASKLEMQSPEQVAKLREEFIDTRAQLRKEWEQLNHKEWPKYKEDVFNENGVRIRKAGDCYDAHHIQPLQLGGKNEVSNITPLDLSKHAEIHSTGGSCSKLVESVEGARL